VQVRRTLSIKAWLVKEGLEIHHRPEDEEDEDV
jgi:hypothetical protein